MDYNINKLMRERKRGGYRNLVGEVSEFAETGIAVATTP